MSWSWAVVRVARAVSTLIAAQGHRVLLLEKEHFPRYQIGESLLPATVHGIGRLLGVSQRLAEAGFMPKRGGTFQWGESPEPWTFCLRAPPTSSPAPRPPPTRSSG